MIQPLAKQKGMTERGTRYILSQYAPNIIQLTLQSGEHVITETLENLQSEQEMLTRRNLLEDEFIQWITPPQLSQENTNEASNQISQ